MRIPEFLKISTGLVKDKRRAWENHQIYRKGRRSLVCVFMTEEEVNDYDSAVKSDTGLFGRYFNHL